MKRVLDSSVGFKWVVPEPHSDKALRLRDDCRRPDGEESSTSLSLSCCARFLALIVICSTAASAGMPGYGCFALYFFNNIRNSSACRNASLSES